MVLRDKKPLPKSSEQKVGFAAPDVFLNIFFPRFVSAEFLWPSTGSPIGKQRALRLQRVVVGYTKAVVPN